MTKLFYNRLSNYFEKVGEVLRGHADVASIFPNTSDIGLSRELTYTDFLIKFLPSKCNIFLGGFLFDTEGNESKQIDVIITSDTALRFNLYNPDGKGKSFGIVEGCLGIVSIKSNLSKNEIIDSLEGIASIPATQPIDNRVNPLLKFDNYENWPYKIIYASNGINPETALKHINDFYSTNSQIPFTRRPDIIHVIGKYFIFKSEKDIEIQYPDGTYLKIAKNEYHYSDYHPDKQALIRVVLELQIRASIAGHILFDYTEILNKINPQLLASNE